MAKHERCANSKKRLDTESKLSKVTTALLKNRTDHMVEMTITNDLTQHTVMITTKKNVHEMIADDHPREIAPTPTRAVRAAQAITTEMVQHSTMTKRNIRSYNNT
jgi:predicted restriction endonuclease